MSSVGQTAKNTAKSLTKLAIKKKLNILTLKWKLIVGGILIVGILLVGIIAGIISSIVGGDSNSNIGGGVIGFGQAQVSPEVAQYRGAISAELEKYGLGEYTELLLALMMQESGGRGNDPMQASESKCGRIGCITNPQESIEAGVKHFVSVFNKANKDVKLTLQSYNFGGGFINFVMENGGQYTFELAVQFSQMMYQKLKHQGIYSCVRAEAVPYQACYGDILYVEAVLKYVNTTLAVGGSATGIEVADVGLKWVGNSIYIFGGGRTQSDIDRGRFDCSSFVHWAFAQIGIELGSRGSVTTDSLKHLGQTVSSSDIQIGDIVFFDTYKIDGHVGIYVGNGKFIGAQSSTGVAIADMSTGYWAKTFNGRVKRIL